jgi:CDGSH-type Zn-finger protein/uncharacterized Fe-S cluster protein YjdI
VPDQEVTLAHARKQPGVDRAYGDERIEVTWEPDLCIHAGECFGNLPDVFRPRERPWVRLDMADADALARTVARCPTGALGIRRLDGNPEEPVPEPPVFEPQPDGPMYVRGRVRVTDETGAVIREDTRMALCRCGHSANKPFCDNSHLRVGFKSDEGSG